MAYNMKKMYMTNTSNTGDRMHETNELLSHRKTRKMRKSGVTVK